MALTPETMRMIWLFLVVVLLIIELVSAFLLSLAGLGIGWQIGVFLVVSIVLFVFTRPWAMKYVNKKSEKTNYEGVIGRTVKVTQEINNTEQTGKAVYDGQEWTARSADDNTVIEAGQLARVVRIEGVKLIVREKEEK